MLRSREQGEARGGTSAGQGLLRLVWDVMAEERTHKKMREGEWTTTRAARGARRVRERREGPRGEEGGDAPSG